jgi:hypothetical protein
MRRAYYLFGWGYVLTCAALAVSAGRRTNYAQPSRSSPATRYARPSDDAAAWFRRVKPYCNAVEVHVLQRETAVPAGATGAGYQAACFALAGHIDDARRVIDRLPANERYVAAGIVFNVGHPVADAGDDRSAGPIMELVIDYWPNHYMALYHASMAEYMLGQRNLAMHNLEEFLKFYDENDGWRANGIEVLRRLRDTTGAQTDLRRLREPQE